MNNEQTIITMSKEQISLQQSRLLAVIRDLVSAVTWLVFKNGGHDLSGVKNTIHNAILDLKKIEEYFERFE
jgi:hypothetical protein